MLKKDEGDTGGGDSGRDGGVIALYLDAPPAAAAEPPSMSVKLVLANENDPGLEFAGASMLPDDEVVIGEDRKRRSQLAIDQTRGAALRRPVVRAEVSGVYVRAGRHGGGSRAERRRGGGVPHPWALGEDVWWGCG